jgi:citrate synthase
MGSPRAYDPRAPRLFQIAQDNGFSGDYIRLEQLICAEAERVAGKMLPVNATGAIGVLARAIGLVGHILEESKNPMAVEIWQRVEDEATRHIRPQSA